MTTSNNVKKAATKKVTAKKPTVKKVAKKIDNKAIKADSIFEKIEPKDTTPIFIETTNKKVLPLKSSRPVMAKKIRETLNSENKNIQLKENFAGSRFISLLVLVAILSSVITFGITRFTYKNAPTATTFLAKISGGVALSEPELRVVVKQLKRTVYWTGPQRNARYTINALTDGQTYIRYLPEGKGVADTAPKYRTVGTYVETDAYVSTLAAGNEANGVSYTTSDGRVIHYNKTSQGNVYVAYKSKNFQIEIFDPATGVALKIANSDGLSTI